MLYKTINLPTNPSSDTGGRPKGSPITYAKACGIVKDFPHAVCTFDDDSFNLNEFLDGAFLQCTVNANGEPCPPSDLGSCSEQAARFGFGVVGGPSRVTYAQARRPS